jgi:hypothetical protein
VLHGEQQVAQVLLQSPHLGGGQVGQQPLLLGEPGADRLVDQRPPVGGIARPDQVPGSLQPVQPVLASPGGS